MATVSSGSTTRAARRRPQTVSTWTFGRPRSPSREGWIMNKTFIVALTTLLLTAGAASAASSETEVQLALDESSILPAAPTGLRVTVLNHGQEPLQLPPSLALI